MRCCPSRFRSGEWGLLALVVFAAFCPTLAVVSARADEEELRRRLEELPQPWKEGVHRVTQPEYEETLRFWGEKHPGTLSVEQVGTSTKGMAIHLLVITDKSVPEADKQVGLGLDIPDIVLGHLLEELGRAGPGFDEAHGDVRLRLQAADPLHALQDLGRDHEKTDGLGRRRRLGRRGGDPEEGHGGDQDGRADP